MRKLALITLLAALVHNASAQRMSAGPHFAGNFAPQHSASFSHSFLYPIPFFSDSFYSGTVYPSGYAQVQPIIVMQAQPAPEPERVAAPAEPLLIELQGDRYVRVSGEGDSGAQVIDGDTINRPTDQTQDEAQSVPRFSMTPRPIAVSAQATLVFRDGHREEIGAYTITDGILYASGDYYSNGSWNHKVELSSLDLTETVSANRSRGVRFQLPSSPNEVIVGP